ncbi:hypothetical protein INT48_003712 [Thamnidium elegans]|uniref:Uncharacterized protein n=1 Tax=Thamnidium elegans TaxID=101142 RepID=A0A8H7VRT1_9FUNG|nr:hypothetical protein INT48_003712 [Thamnidium elegans]
MIQAGLRDVFVAADGNHLERHRIRTTTTAEYYQPAGFKKATITRGKIGRGDAEERAIISATPSLKQTLSEISKRLITGSRKYDPTRHMVIEDSNKKWKQLSPGDGPK